MGFYPVPHESSANIIMIYFNIILQSVRRSLNVSFNVVYNKYISDSEQYQHNIITSTPMCSVAGRARLAASVAVLYVYAWVWTFSYSH